MLGEDNAKRDNKEGRRSKDRARSLRSKQDEAEREKKRERKPEKQKESNIRKASVPVFGRGKEKGGKKEGRGDIKEDKSTGGKLEEKEGSNPLEDKKEKPGGIGGRLGFNPLSYSSIKENVIEKGIDDSVRVALNKYGGLGNLIQFAHKLKTGKDKVEYSKAVNFRGKLLIIFATLTILLVAWLFLVVSLFIVIFGAVAIIILNDSNITEGKKDDTGGGSGEVSSGKIEPMPPELEGKFIFPNAERITSLYQPSRVHPVFGVVRAHAGVDIAHRNQGVRTLKLYPIAPGKVFQVVDVYPGDSGSGWGNYVRIDHGTHTSLYGHLKQGIPVKVGDEVGMRTVLGIMGSTGDSSAPHLHLEIYTGGQGQHTSENRLNPLHVMSCTDTKPAPRVKGTYPECHQYQQKIRGISGD